MIKPHRQNLQPKYFVSMTDKFLSGWGKAEGKTNKYVIGTSSWEQALAVKRNAQRRSEMKYINIHSTLPRYNKRRYVVSRSHWNKLGDIWKQ